MISRILFVRRRTAIALVSLGLVASVILVLAARSSALSTDELAIQQLVIQAETAKDTLAVTGAPATGRALDPSYIQATQARAAAVLDSLYSPLSPLLGIRRQQVQRGLEMQKNGYFTVVGGGIRDVSFETISISGNVATVHVTFVNYAAYVTRQPDGGLIHSTPSNKVIADIALLKTDQGWRITNDVGRFAPGSEP